MADPRLTPRKEPRQARARVTVEAILEAAERLTREGGIDPWTTNHVAERAGVSVGSLYQYFPGKESLVVALYLHRRERYVEGLASALVAVSRSGSPHEVATAIVDAWFGVDGGAAGAIDWAFDAAVRAFLVASRATRKLAASDAQLAGILGQLVARRDWAPAELGPARGALALAAVERVLAVFVVDEPRWRTEPALRATMIAVVAAALGPAI